MPTYDADLAIRFDFALSRACEGRETPRFGGRRLAATCTRLLNCGVANWKAGGWGRHVPETAVCRRLLRVEPPAPCVCPDDSASVSNESLGRQEMEEIWDKGEERRWRVSVGCSEGLNDILNGRLACIVPLRSRRRVLEQ